MTNRFTSDAITHYQRGDYAAAKQAYEVALQKAPSPEAWLGLANVHKALNEQNARLQAIDKALHLAPQHILSLIAKGDYYDDNAKPKLAGPFYGQALTLAQQAGNLAQPVLAELQRAQTKCQAYAKSYEHYLFQELGDHLAITDENDNRVFRKSLEIITGKRNVWLQQPTQYYYPELPAISFFDLSYFPWVENLQKATPDIRAELEQNLDSNIPFSPYVQRTVDTPRQDHGGMMDNPGWSALFLWRDGKPIEETQTRFPKTTSIMKTLPKADIPGHSPSVLFSLLRPGVKIPPHTGLMNTRLIAHLPLIIPNGCAIRVGGDNHEWKEGEVVIFDDTINHEAWNNSKDSRYVLIFDVPHPMLSQNEHDSVRGLFNTIRAYGEN